MNLNDKRKRIGILTFAFADNYGAVLQGFALRKYINRLTNCEAEIIYYIPLNYRYGRMFELQLKGEEAFREKRACFESFLQNECGCNMEEVFCVSGNEYDYYCVGSDQVWNTVDKNFFFANVDVNAKRISYAASFGLSLNDPKLRKEFCKEYVSKFKSISVREEEHVEMVKELTGKECVSVIDPTLLLDEADYLPLLPKEKLREGEFIFFFWLEQNSDPFQAFELVNNLARKYKLPIVHSFLKWPSNMLYSDGGTMMNEGVENFLWYMKHAKFVVTNSFHGTIFSIIFKKPFYTFVAESIRSRIDTLVGKLGIGDRVVEKYLSPKDYSEQIDYEKIYKNIVRERAIAHEYLKGALDIDDEII